LLRDIAGVLQESVRSNDLVARLGGDEFAVLVLDATRSALAETAQRIVKRLAFSLSSEDGHRIEVTCSIGIAVHPQDGDDAASLLKQADKAMYAAKGRGKHGYGFASEDSGATD
jgi:diguanylate cyclase (GGDEF)-like protein